MRTMKSVLLLITLFVTPGLFSQTTHDPALLAEVRASIDSVNQQWIKGFETGDIEQVMATFAPDAIKLGQDGKSYQGLAAIRTLITAIMDFFGGDVRITVNTSKVWVVGDKAYETGEYTYRIVRNGNPVTETGIYCSMWMKQPDNSWKIALDVPVK